jgi:hypothetical protein
VKLLLCLKCNDIFNLDYEEKRCKCGQTKGKYLDTFNAIYEGEKAIPLGFANFSFANAIRNQPSEGLGERFTAFTIPKVCPTFVKTENNLDYTGGK